MFSKDAHGTAAQFWGLSWQHQAHMADSETIRLFLRALMHRHPRGLGGNSSGHMWNLRCLAPGDLQTSLSASPLPAFLHPLLAYLLNK